MKLRKLATGFVALAIVSGGVSGPAIAQQPVLAPAAKKYTTMVLNQGVPKIDVLTTKVGQDIESIVIFSAPLTTKSGKSAGNIAGFLTDLEIGATGAEIRFRNISFMLKGGQIIANGTGEYESADREMPVERRQQSQLLVEQVSTSEQWVKLQRERTQTAPLDTSLSY